MNYEFKLLFKNQNKLELLDCPKVMVDEGRRGEEEEVEEEEEEGEEDQGHNYLADDGEDQFETIQQVKCLR